jgi:hypothetical protein
MDSPSPGSNINDSKEQEDSSQVDENGISVIDHNLKN